MTIHEASVLHQIPLDRHFSIKELGERAKVSRQVVYRVIWTLKMMKLVRADGKFHRKWHISGSRWTLGRQEIFEDFEWFRRGHARSMKHLKDNRLSVAHELFKEGS